MAIEPATLESGNRIPFLQTLGIQLHEIGDRHAIMQVTVSEMHRCSLPALPAPPPA